MSVGDTRIHTHIDAYTLFTHIRTYVRARVRAYSLSLKHSTQDLAQPVDGLSGPQPELLPEENVIPRLCV